MTVIEAPAASRRAVAAAASVSSTCGSRATNRSTRSISSRTAVAFAPSRLASTTARYSRWAPSKRSRFLSTVADCEPGTANPPAVRCSLWRAANGRAAEQEHAPDAEHEQAATLQKRLQAGPSLPAWAAS